VIVLGSDLQVATTLRCGAVLPSSPRRRRDTPPPITEAIVGDVWRRRVPSPSLSPPNRHKRPWRAGPCRKRHAWRADGGQLRWGRHWPCSQSMHGRCGTSIASQRDERSRWMDEWWRGFMMAVRYSTHAAYLAGWRVG